MNVDAETEFRNAFDGLSRMRWRVGCYLDGPALISDSTSDLY